MSVQVRSLAAAVSLVAVCALTACGSDDPVLPQTSEGSTSIASVDDLVAAATSLYDCLAAADVPVIYENGPDGQQTMVGFDPTVAVVWSMPDMGVQWTDVTPENEINAVLARLDQQYSQATATAEPVASTALDFEPESILTVAGVDRSDVWQQCLADSGYDEMAVWDNYDNSDATVIAEEQLVVDATNQWAECAREHGFPEVADVQMSTSDQEYPAALLPASITADQLRQLLTDCPSFDPAVADANAALNESSDEPVPDGVKGQPSIGFDYPGFDTDWSDDAEASTDPAVVEHLEQLLPIVRAAEEAYYAALRASNAAATAASTP
ncbi:MAG: hypothetical protein LBL92_01970 [Propionibacteriaceae bacterium]|jgi:hypothetical protein|nr:hypothetical protein [Propionibacteriaceae bacterium]